MVKSKTEWQPILMVQCLHQNIYFVCKFWWILCFLIFWHQRLCRILFERWLKIYQNCIPNEVHVGEHLWWDLYNGMLHRCIPHWPSHTASAPRSGLTAPLYLPPSTTPQASSWMAPSWSSGEGTTWYTSTIRSRRTGSSCRWHSASQGCFTQR